jgi:hypothetical protein
MNHRQIKVVLGLAATILLGTDLCAWTAFSHAKNDADNSVRDAQICQQLASRIASLKTQPAMAGTSQQAIEELAALVQTSAQSFGIKADDIASIAPDAPTRLADSPYLEQSTTVELREITLGQLVDLLSALSNHRSGLRIKALHLTAPPQQIVGNAWSAEITVSSLIYSPETNPESNTGRI